MLVLKLFVSYHTVKAHVPLLKLIFIYGFLYMCLIISEALSVANIGMVLILDTGINSYLEIF